MYTRHLSTLEEKFGSTFLQEGEVDIFLEKEKKLSDEEKFSFLPYIKVLYIPENDILSYNKFEYEKLENLDSEYYLKIKVVKWTGTELICYYFDDHHHRLTEFSIKDNTISGTKIMVEGNILRLLPL